MLQNALHDEADLRQVRINSDHAVAEGRPPLPYQQYLPLLLSATAAHDNTTSPTKWNNARRAIYNTIGDTLEFGFGSPPLDDDLDYNIDTYLTNVTSRSPSNSSRKSSSNGSNPNMVKHNRLPRDVWMRIPEDIHKLLSQAVTNTNVVTPDSNGSNDDIIIQNFSVMSTDSAAHSSEASGVSLLEHSLNNTKLSETNIQQVYNTNSGIVKVGEDDSTIRFNNNTYRKINFLCIEYSFNQRRTIIDFRIIVGRSWCQRWSIGIRCSYSRTDPTSCSYYRSERSRSR
jgi:hypothetical protein